LIILVTGTSSGFGKWSALAFARRGHRVIATMRDPDRSSPLMEEAHRQQVAELIDICRLDVNDAAEAGHVMETVIARHGRLDVLVNNAGYAQGGMVEEVPLDEWRAQMETNFFAAVRLTQLAVPHMRRQRSGLIVNVSSISGRMALPGFGPYSASKFALEGASEALYYEVRPWNVHVTLVAPGFINSDGFKHVEYTSGSREASGHPSSPYHSHYEYMADFIAKAMKRVPSTPESVAARVVRLLGRRRPPLRLYGTFDAALFAFMRRLLPRSLYHEILYRSLPGIRHWGPH